VTTGAECKNCRAPLAGAYCSVCGQKGDVRIPSLHHVLADALGDLVNFDSRIWRSLIALTFKPGRLTSAYLAGQRARYAPPFRMYLVTSVAFFLAFSLVRPENQPPDGVASTESIDASVAAALEEPGLTTVPAESAATERAESAAPVEVEGITLGEDGRWECGVDRGMSPAMQARLEAACRKIEADSGASFGRAFAENVPVMMLIFIPVVALIMKVLYVFSRRKYVEHLLFLLHVHTFFFLTALLGILLSRAADLTQWLAWPEWIFGFVAWIYFPIYLYLALRRVYAQGHALTIAKYVALGATYTFAFMLTLLGLVVYTALTL
jgi:hypothetical protein